MRDHRTDSRSGIGFRAALLLLPRVTALCAVYLFSAAVLAAEDRPPAAADHPNIILFIVDDLGWQDISLPLHTEATPFNERYRTPNVEALARRGVRFTNAYASAPVCTPTRTSIMTGQSPGRSHITYWTLHKDRDTSREHPTLAAPSWRVNGLQQDDVTLPGLLRGAGYRTIHVGKAHFGAHDTSGGDPANLGFDVNIAGHASGAPASYRGTHAFSAAGREGKPGSKTTVWDVPGLESWHGKDIHLTDALAIEACGAVRSAIEDGVPFYLNMAPYAVHTPIMANRSLLAAYEDLPPQEAAYATMIESFDQALGAIVAVLRELGVEDDTVIVFTSDNGGLSAHARAGQPHVHNAPLRSGKGSAYEGGTRVPAVLVVPGVTAAGTVCAEPIVTHDLFPTLLALAGVEMPAAHAPSVDGRDLAPLLHGATSLGPAADGAPRPLFWHQPHQWGASGPGIEPFTSVRRGRWKLIYFHGDRRFELYDLASDIGETNDLSQDRPDTAAALAACMDDWIKTANVQRSIDRATGEPIEDPLAALSSAGD